MPTIKLDRVEFFRADGHVFYFVITDEDGPPTGIQVTVPAEGGLPAMFERAHDGLFNKLGEIVEHARTLAEAYRLP